MFVLMLSVMNPKSLNETFFIVAAAFVRWADCERPSFLVVLKDDRAGEGEIAEILD